VSENRKERIVVGTRRRRESSVSSVLGFLQAHDGIERRFEAPETAGAPGGRFSMAASVGAEESRPTPRRRDASGIVDLDDRAEDPDHAPRSEG